MRDVARERDVDQAGPHHHCGTEGINLDIVCLGVEGNPLQVRTHLGLGGTPEVKAGRAGGKLLEGIAPGWV